MINKESKNAVRVRKHERVRAKVKGSATCPRLCVFRSNKHIEAQLIDDVAKATLISSSSVQLKLENGSNIEAAKKVGADLAAKAKAKKISTVVFDRGGYVYHGRVAALADAAREGGLKF
ncbi:MAG: 50S ribosomal protein L18 [Bacilli bacterium]|nr:50S ribosomal protein L18 [Bacilli bacterium]